MPARLAQAAPPITTPAAALPLGPPPISGVCALVVPDGGTANLDWTGLAGLAFRVLDIWLVKTGGAGGAGDTIQLQTTAGAAISDAMSINVADQVVVNGALMDDATHSLAAGAGLRVRRFDNNAGATDLSCIVYVEIAVV